MKKHYNITFILQELWMSFIILLLLAFMPVKAGTEEAHSNSAIVALQITEEVKVDGILNEGSWKNAFPVTTFTQRELSEGEPATEQTDVRTLYDRDNLYIGVVCFDSNPEAIISKEQKRDSEMSSDDTFAIIIDTFSDHRNAYLFVTNPNGTRYDALVKFADFGVNGTPYNSWDGVWNVASHIDDRGWTAEFVIPFKTLRFPSTPEQQWNINFRREIRRKNEEILWFAWRQNQGLFHLSETGTLAGIRGIEQKLQADIKPYIMTGIENEEQQELNREFKSGLDIRYAVTSELTLDMTTFTDFAQVESDQEEINLTRFSIRYPEKREFFIEGSDIFDFASSVSSPFYTRRVGISPDREQVPILGGGKLIGKAGSYDIGFINMQTDEKDSTLSTNYSVVRVKKNILEKSYIGFIATNVIDSAHDSQCYGADFAYNTSSFLGSQNLTFGSYIAENRSPGIQHGNHAGRLYLALPNDLYRIHFLYHSLGESYYPEIGYVDRNGIKKYETNIAFTPRSSIPYVKKFTFSPGMFQYITDSGTKLLTRTLRATPVGVELDSGDRFSFGINNTYENIDKDFTIFKVINIPQGEYSWWVYSFSGSTSTKRPFSVNFQAGAGDFWNGKNKTLDVSGTLKTSKFYSVTLQTIANTITMDSKKFNTVELNTRIVVDFTPNLNSRTFIQWNNETDVVNINFLIRYIPRAGSDIYFVYNHLFNEAKDYRTIKNTGILKASYLFRF